MPIEIGIPVVSTHVLNEPGVFGAFRPVLLLPEGMGEHLSKAEWEAILAYELCHVRYYDNLTAAIYMLVETLFWFHPLVWWMGKRLIAEREFACDEEVLRLGSEPKVYAEGILKVCELYLESPLECVAGAAGSNLRRRLRAIMTHRGTERMTIGKRLVLASVGTLSVALPIAAGVVNASSIRIQSAVPVALIQNQPRPARTPKLEVVAAPQTEVAPVVSPGLVTAQAQPPASQSQQPRISPATQMVVMNVPVHDSHGNDVNDLRIGNFQVFEDSKPCSCKRIWWTNSSSALVRFF
jgi:hypothetical protein